MSDELSLTLFAHVCASPEQNFAEAAILIAEVEHPRVDVAGCMRVLDELAEGMRLAMGRPRGATPDVGTELLLEPAARWLHAEAGFHGNDEDYYDPSNSFLDDVLERRTGIPISLAVVLIEVCRRAGIGAAGVSFPGHFLVTSAPHGRLFVDPFTGRVLDKDDLQSLYARATGDAREPPARLLAPAPKAQILLRMLANLGAIYTSRSDTTRLCAVLERIHILAPSEELAQQIAKLGGKGPWRPAARGGSGMN